MHILVHFIDKKQHCDIEFNVQSLADVCQPIEKFAVLTAKMNRHDITLILDAFCDEGLFI